MVYTFMAMVGAGSTLPLPMQSRAVNPLVKAPERWCADWPGTADPAIVNVRVVAARYSQAVVVLAARSARSGKSAGHFRLRPVPEMSGRSCAQRCI
jgi:hypothetical protein